MQATAKAVSPTAATPDPQEIAEHSTEVMLAGDRATAALGMAVLEVAPGRAVVEMTVREEMLNGWGTCHGALVAAVGDTAFAVACNSYGEMTVAAGFDISFLAPARVGDRLVATAQRRSAAGRSGVYDVSIERVCDDGDHGDHGVGERTVVAELRGRSRALGRPVARGARA